MKITGYEAICKLGNSIDEIYKNAIDGDVTCFENLEGYINGEFVHVGIVKAELPEIDNPDFDIRCNRLILKNLELLNDKIAHLKCSRNKIGIICATTNSGADEYKESKNPKHYELSNPAFFLKEYLGLDGFCTTVSTACSSGIKAFSLARDLINNDVCDAVIVVCTDALSKVPLYGFNSLEVLSNKHTIPFSKNRSGINIGEASAIFIVEKDAPCGIDILGIGETSDIYHSTTPDPKAGEVVKALKNALNDANIESVDYINLHGTGTEANDIMEANAIFEVFGDSVPSSSTKPLTGHCLGSAAGIEIALCCKLLERFNGKLYPHIYDNNYDESLPKINLVKKSNKYKQCKVCMCNSFGFGGTNAIIILENKFDLSRILPHDYPMILIDDIVSYSMDEKWLKSKVIINEKSLFYDKDISGIDSTIGIEYMAQTIGCYAYLKKEQKEPKIGFLLGTRLYNNFVEKFDLGKTYYILVKEVFVADINSFECLIYNEENDEIASATINVYQEE